MRCVLSLLFLREILQMDHERQPYRPHAGVKALKYLVGRKMCLPFCREMASERASQRECVNFGVFHLSHSPRARERQFFAPKLTFTLQLACVDENSQSERENTMRRINLAFLYAAYFVKVVKSYLLKSLFGPVWFHYIIFGPHYIL